MLRFADKEGKKCSYCQMECFRKTTQIGDKIIEITYSNLKLRNHETKKLSKFKDFFNQRS